MKALTTQTRNLSLRKGVIALVIALLSLSATIASAHDITSAVATATCQGYHLTVNTSNLVNGDYVYYVFNTTCGATKTNFDGTIYFNGNNTLTAQGEWNLSADCIVIGSAKLVYFENGQQLTKTVPIVINGVDTEFGPATLNCQPPSHLCTTGPQSLARNLSEKPSNAGQIVWFNSHFKLQGTIPTTDFTVFVTNQEILFGGEKLTPPDAEIRFVTGVSCASTTFDTEANRWITTVPLSYATKADEIFAAGLGYILPPDFSNSVNNITWSATFTSTAPTLKIPYQYGIANYLISSKGMTFPLTTVQGVVQPNYNAMQVDPVHNAPTCANYDGGNHAGTPENATVKKLVTGGGSGGGGSNWTGSWSSTPTYICVTP